MRAFIDQGNNLVILLTGETPEDLIQFSSITELIQVYLPRLTPIDNPTTNAPIFGFNGQVWYFPDHLTVDALEELRDNGSLRLTVVE